MGTNLYYALVMTVVTIPSPALHTAILSDLITIIIGSHSLSAFPHLRPPASNIIHGLSLLPTHLYKEVSPNKQFTSIHYFPADDGRRTKHQSISPRVLTKRKVYSSQSPFFFHLLEPKKTSPSVYVLWPSTWSITSVTKSAAGIT
jgi:hypothetical protein